MGYDDASVVLLTCGDDSSDGAGARSGVAARWPYSDPVAAATLLQYGAHMRAVAVPARPGRADIDPLLAGPLRRIVVAGSDADLAAVLVRLLRRDRLDVELAYVPTDRRSAAARLWGLPHGAAAVELAREGVARPAPLVRDDAGGVLVGRGEIRGTAGSVHGEAYCDGVLALRGSARRLVVTPWPDAASISRQALRSRRPIRRRHNRRTSSSPHPPGSRCGRAAGAACPTAAADRCRRPPVRAGAPPSAAPSRWAACPPPWCTTAWCTRGPSRGGPGTGTSPTGCSSDDDGGHTHSRRTVVPVTG